MQTTLTSDTHNATDTPELTHADRCDRCTSRALVVTLIPTERGTTPLMWCHHHYRQHRDQLLEIAAAIRDDTHLLEDG